MPPREAASEATPSCRQPSPAKQTTWLLKISCSGVLKWARHLGGNGHADGISDSLAKGPVVHSTPGVSPNSDVRGLAVQLSEVLDFLKRKIEPGEITVKEHAPVTGGQNETIPIDPLCIRWIDLKVLTEQYGPEFGSAEGKPEVCPNCMREWHRWPGLSPDQPLAEEFLGFA